MNLYYDKAGAPIDFDTFNRLFEDIGYRHVAMDARGDFEISTVWLGINHRFTSDGPPMIFETMIFGPAELAPASLEGYQRRWSTEAQALEGHAEAVALVEQALAKVRR